MTDLERGIDDWLGFSEPPKSKEKVKPGGKLDVREAVAFVEQGVMSEAQLAVGLLGVSSLAKQLLSGGITHDALSLLIQASIPRLKNGNPVPFKIILDVLRGAAALDGYVDRAALEKVRAARAKR